MVIYFPRGVTPILPSSYRFCFRRNINTISEGSYFLLLLRSPKFYVTKNLYIQYGKAFMTSGDSVGRFLKVPFFDGVVVSVKTESQVFP
jgi:hypothetical protein